MFGLSDEEWQDLVLSVNTHRKQRRLTPVEVAKLVVKAEGAAPLDKIAKALNFGDTTTLSRIRLLADLNPSLAALVDWGGRRGWLSMSTAANLIRIREPELIEKAFTLAIENEITKDEAKQLIQIYNRSDISVENCFDKILSSRTKIEKSELILGSILSDQAKEKLILIPKDVLLKKMKMELARKYPNVVILGLKLGPENRFSLFLSASDGVVFRKLIFPKTVEQTITFLLEGVSPK
jgi:hypothetical protein